MSLRKYNRSHTVKGFVQIQCVKLLRRAEEEILEKKEVRLRDGKGKRERESNILRWKRDQWVLGTSQRLTH